MLSGPANYMTTVQGRGWSQQRPMIYEITSRREESLFTKLVQHHETRPGGEEDVEIACLVPGIRAIE